MEERTGQDIDQWRRRCSIAREHLAHTRRQADMALRRSVRRRSVAPPTAPARPAPPSRDWEAGLIEAHLGLARHLAARYQRRGEASDDLEQVALLALVRAARRFDPSRGTPFAAFATPSVLGELKRHFRDRVWGVRVSRPTQEVYMRAKAARDDLIAETGQVPTVAEVADRLAISVESVISAMEAGQNFRPASLDGLEEARSHELPASDGGFDLALDRQRLGELVPYLDPDERLILRLRFYEERTQREIAARLGVSQMHISRSLERILTKLRSGFVVQGAP